MVGSVTRVSIPQPHRPVLPTSTTGAAGQSAVGMNELLVRVGLPVRRLTATRDDHARTVRWLASFGFHSCRQMHQTGHRAEHALGVIDQTYQFAERRLTTQVNYTVQPGMMVPLLANLDKLNFPAE